MSKSDTLTHLRNQNLKYIVTCLVWHGCHHITDSMHPRHCPHPYARGGFGTIYRGMLQSGLHVAIKCIESHNDDKFLEQSKGLRRAAREIYVWSRCSHKGILPMLGFIRLKGQIALITPWMESGSLQRHIVRGLLNTPLCTVLGYI
ncbi:tyrosine kinase domain protein [Rhizoctonia solani 123E]|uniref:Tyrosine kinase domain protein n=1 Tax=Rhizoctonia solani 123E TaxID=1423351 RepID=A0A074SEY4_9AGAM|nr:tyrosine kinase domain protein [Rhizoctonia solani 123E]